MIYSNVSRSSSSNDKIFKKSYLESIGDFFIYMSNHRTFKLFSLKSLGKIMFKTFTLEPLFYFTLSPLLPFSTFAAGHCVPLGSTVHRVWPHHQHSSKVFFSSFLQSEKGKASLLIFSMFLSLFMVLLSVHNLYFSPCLLYTFVKRRKSVYALL